MLQRLFLLSMACGLSGCALAAPSDSYTVAEVLADISSEESQLDGKVVKITGWLGECWGNNCSIYSTSEDAELVGSYRELPAEEWLPASHRGLNIGSDEAFDSQALYMQYSKVVITAEVNAQWKKPVDEDGNKFGCLGRCSDLRPKSIEKILF